MTIFMLACVAFIAWHFIPQRAPKADPRFRRDARITASNPHWRVAIEEHCESPAESAFLKAMIDAHQLQPRAGALCSDSLKLDLQVEQSKYRADFLVNDWLVVEIDGAAWHSSPAQQSRDAVRDEHFTGLDYAVLRIPAKTVFQRPDEAVRAVSARLASGKPQLAEPVQPGGLKRLAGTMRGISEGVSEFNKDLSRSQAVNQAMNAPRAAFGSEQQALEFAMERANRQIKIDEYCATQEKRESLERHKKRIGDALAQSAPESGDPPVKLSLTVIEMVKPIAHQDPEIDANIQSFFSSLLAEREKMYDDARRKIEQDPRLRLIVMRTLIDLTCLSVAERLHGQKRPQLLNLGQLISWQHVLVHGEEIPLPRILDPALDEYVKHTRSQMVVRVRPHGD